MKKELEVVVRNSIPRFTWKIRDAITKEVEGLVNFKEEKLRAGLVQDKVEDCLWSSMGYFICKKIDETI